MSFPIGSISSGTLKSEDLIPAFISECEYHGIDVAALNLAYSKQKPYQLMEGGTPIYDPIEVDDENHPYWTSDDAAFDIDALCDALNEFCPPFVYFGAHPGDPADFGFWPDVEAVEDTMRREGIRLDDERCLLPDDQLIVHVNDHGNMSLYKLEIGEEVWSVV